jgi:hypothetical protein
MSLCQLCLTIPIEELPPVSEHFSALLGSFKYINEFWDERLQDDPEIAKPPIGFPYHPDLHTLRDSANKCDLCNLVLTAVDNFISEFPSTPDEKSEARRKYNSNYDYSPTFKFWITKRNKFGDGFLVWTTSDNPRNIFLVAGVGFCVQEGMMTHCCSFEMLCY